MTTTHRQHTTRHRFLARMQLSERIWHKVCEDAAFVVHAWWTLPLAQFHATVVSHGVLERLRDRLLLPESYHVMGLRYNDHRRVWEVIVRSLELPHTLPGESLPIIKPMYARSVEGQVSLVRIDFDL